MTSWQKGYDIEMLKTLKKVFQKDYKPYVFGAFGMPNERDIADALANGKVVKTNNDTIAIYQVYSAKSKITDFTQTNINIQSGWVYIKHIAGAQKKKILKYFIDKIESPILLEIFDEDVELKNLVEYLGFKYVTTKIAASSDLKGIYCRNVNINYSLPDVEKINIKQLSNNFLSNKQLSSIRHELEIYSSWANHYSSYNKRQSWSAFSIRGYEPTDSNFIIKPNEMSQSWKKENPEKLVTKSDWTNIAHLFPETKKIVESMFFNAVPDRVRFMKLTKGKGELSRHADITDKEAGVMPNKVVRLHIPIQTNEDVIFQSWSHKGEKSVVNMPEGTLWYLDVRKPHTAVNNGDLDRIHLVMDFYSNEELTKFINK
jgi:hypothetical protein